MVPCIFKCFGFAYDFASIGLIITLVDYRVGISNGSDVSFISCPSTCLSCWSGFVMNSFLTSVYEMPTMFGLKALVVIKIFFKI
jgi:hypothetical protein